MKNHVSIFIDLQRCKLHSIVRKILVYFLAHLKFLYTSNKCIILQWYAVLDNLTKKHFRFFLHLKWLIDYPKKKSMGAKNIDFWNSNLIWIAIIRFSRYIYVHLFHISIISKEISENESSKHNYRVSKSSKYLAHSY